MELDIPNGWLDYPQDIIESGQVRPPDPAKMDVVLIVADRATGLPVAIAWDWDCESDFERIEPTREAWEKKFNELFLALKFQRKAVMDRLPKEG